MGVSMAALPDLITVAQFLEMPEGGEHTYELHYGVVVPVTRPSFRHNLRQSRLSRLLQPKVQSFGEVLIETAYRPVAEFDVRAADVALVSHARIAAIGPGELLRGAPELVIEVKSPSNRRGKLQELAGLCLANGAIEFWILDQDRKSVSVVHRDGTTTLYGPGGSVPLSAFGAGDLSVDEIFA